MPPIRPLLQRLAATMALVGASICAAGALIAQGGRFSGWMDLASHAAPLWVVGSVAAWLLARLAPHGLHRRLAQTLAVVALVAATPLIWPEFVARRSPPASADAAPRLRVVQANVWDLNTERAKTAEWLLRERPDIIVLEEAQRDLFETLRRDGGYHVSCQDGRPQWCTTAILSLTPPLAAGFHEDDLPGDVAPLARARLAAPDGGDYTVVAAHLDWPSRPADQTRQRKRIAALIAASGRRERIILAGDFNSTPWSFARRADDRVWGLERRTRGLFSWPTPDLQRFGVGWPIAFLPIDHVYAGSDWRTVSVTRGPAVGSDHYPVLVTLALSPEFGRSGR